jgi:hypothetical protein
MKKKVHISEVRENPNNPRTINKFKFKQLVKSIKDFPEMLEKRPMVVDQDMIVLGGNMRLKACKEAGIEDVWIDIAKDWSEEKKKEFIIKDNIGFGEWDFDALANEWDLELITEWGLDVKIDADDVEEMKNPENEETENVFATELDSESNYIVLKFSKDIDWIQALTLFELQTETARRANGKAWSKGVGRVIDGAKAINKITK